MNDNKRKIEFIPMPREPDTKRDRLAQVKKSSGIPKTLARHGSLDEYVDSLPAHEQQPVIDDTFNDDTPAQTFGDIQWDIGTQDKSKAILVTVCSKCGSTVPADSVDNPALSRWAARFLKAWKASEVTK